MAPIVFYEKPGCIGNARQKRLLLAAGLELVVKNILAEPWTPGRLKGFLQGLPVPQWFNPTAPRVKSKAIIPEDLDEEKALAFLIEDPILIRRPLLEIGKRRLVGFDPDSIEACLAEASFGLPRPLSLKTGNKDAFESCPKGGEGNPCPDPQQPQPRKELPDYE